MQAIWDFLVHVAATAPPAFWPLIVGLLVSSLSAQRFKFWLPLRWSVRKRALMTQAVAFWTGLGCTWSLWPDRYGMFCGVIVGIAAPTLWAIGVRLIGLKWPSVRDLLSGDTRP